MIGTGTVKICVKGFADTPYTQQELDDARALIEDAMAAGAPGVSLGIMYLPECYSSTDEFAVHPGAGGPGTTGSSPPTSAVRATAWCRACAR